MKKIIATFESQESSQRSATPCVCVCVCVCVCACVRVRVCVCVCVSRQVSMSCTERVWELHVASVWQLSLHFNDTSLIIYIFVQCLY